MDKPIAWYDPTNGMVSTDKDSPLFTPLGQVLPLYTQRTWVGLTDQEIEDAIYDGFAFGHLHLDNGNVSNQTVIRYVIRVIQAKLKEKNE
jgi:hypothetical protein